MAKTTGYFKRKLEADKLTAYYHIMPNGESMCVYISYWKSRVDHESDPYTYDFINQNLQHYERISQKQFLSALKEAIQPIYKYVSEANTEQPEYGSQEINDAKNQ